MCTKYYTDFTYIEIQRNREFEVYASKYQGKQGRMVPNTVHCWKVKVPKAPDAPRPIQPTFGTEWSKICEWFWMFRFKKWGMFFCS